jgi:6-pyruvoyltetrahydropterin/6-carboxytetrahydropterin synthase
MVDFSLSVERTFGAGHVIPSDPGHQDQHGHHWRVRVTMRGLLDPASGTAGRVGELAQDLAELLHELEGRSINDMLPQSKPTLEGVGMWVIERLSGAYPKISEVEVGWLDPPQQSCLIRREPR